MENQSLSLINGILVLSAYILIIGIIFSKISNKVNLPDVVLFLVAGIIIGPSVLNLANIDAYPTANQFILTFGSAFILYDGGREIKLKVLNSVKITVGFLATIGIVISAICIAFISMYIFKIPFIYAFLIGAVIASTDPATLVPVFKQIKIKDRLKQTVISESAFNDAAGAILVFAILTIIESGRISIGANLQSLVTMIIGGIVGGLLVGLLFSFSISEGKLGLFHEFAPLVSIVAVILSYVFAEKIHGSGYMATFVTGLVCGNKKTFKLWVPSEDFQVQSCVKDTIASIMRMAIFVLLGMHVDFTYLYQYWGKSLIIVSSLIFLARPLSVLVCTFLDRKAKWKANEIIFMMWVRETGVIPAALSSMIVNMDMANKGIISSVVFMTIIITLVVQASSTKMVAKRLNLLEDK